MEKLFSPKYIVLCTVESIHVMLVCATKKHYIIEIYATLLNGSRVNKLNFLHTKLSYKTNNIILSSPG